MALTDYALHRMAVTALATGQHLPALRALSELELTLLESSASTPTSAEAIKTSRQRAFEVGAANKMTEARQLIGDGDYSGATAALDSASAYHNSAGQSLPADFSTLVAEAQQGMVRAAAKAHAMFAEC